MVGCSVFSRWLLFVGLVSVVLGGCSCDLARSERDKTTVVRFWHTFNAQEARTVEGLIQEFESLHPGVDVEVTVLPFGAARNRLREAFRDEKGPDLARAEVAWIPEMAQEGLLLPLEVNLDEHLPQARPFMRFGGETYAYPQGVDCLVLYYNRSLLKKYGVEVPRTMDGLVKAAQSLTLDEEGKNALDADFDKGSIAVYGLYLKGDGYYFLPFLWGMGGATLDPAKREVWIDREASVEAARWFADLVHRHHVVPERLDFSNEYARELRWFGEGRVAMIVQGPWAVQELLRGQEFVANVQNLGIAPVPRGELGQGGSPLGGHGYVVSARGREKELARELAAFLSNTNAQRTLARKNFILPTRQGVYQDKVIRDMPILGAFRGALEQGHERAVFPGMARLFDALTPAMQRLLRGEGDVRVLMEAVGDQWREVLTGVPSDLPSPLDSAPTWPSPVDP